jgi:hypothetical protein
MLGWRAAVAEVTPEQLGAAFAAFVRELPLPDAGGRRRLIDVYARGAGTRSRPHSRCEGSLVSDS